MTVAKGIQKTQQALKNMKGAYATLTTTRQGQNYAYRNVLVEPMVSNAPNTSQNHITKIIGASRYMVIKAMLQCVHVDEIRENLWGGLPRKRCCVVINE
jgi:hypothetical protein